MHLPPKTYHCLTLLCGLLLSTLCPAETIHDLYSTTINIPEHGDGLQHHERLPGALANTLTKTTGGLITLHDKIITDNRPNIASFIESYSYESPYEGQSGKVLKIKFYRKALDQLSIQYGKSLWGQERPTILLWLVIQEPGGNTYILDNNHALAQTIKSAAQLRGIPVYLPLLDTIDQTATTIHAIATHQPSINDASERYHADIVITGTIKLIDDSRYLGNYYDIYHDTPMMFWDTTANSIEDTLTNFVHRLSDHLASTYALTISEQSNHQTSIAISNLASFQQYHDIAHAMETLPIIEHMSITSIDHSNLRMTIQYHGSIAQLIQALASIHINVKHSPDDPTQNNNTLYFTQDLPI